LKESHKVSVQLSAFSFSLILQPHLSLRGALQQAQDKLRDEAISFYSGELPARDEILHSLVWTIPSTLLRTGKDVLGHIASWEETCLEPLRHYADGGPFEVQVIKDYLTWSDEQAVRKRDIPLEVILNESATVRQGLVEAASRLSAEQWKQWVPFAWGSEGTIADTLRGLHVHEMEHVRHIQQWRGG